MAGQAGYYLVALADRSAGIVRVPANQRPLTVAGHTVVKSQYLGTTTQDILANWKQAVKDIGAFGLDELGPPGSQQAIVGSSTDVGTLIHSAMTNGAGILTQTPSSAEWDPGPTILAGGLGGIVSGVVRSAGAAAAGEAAGGGAADAAAGAVTGAGAGGAGVAITGAAGLAGLLGLTDNWQQLLIRALEALAGMALLLLGLQALTGQGDGNPVTLGRKVAGAMR